MKEIPAEIRVLYDALLMMHCWFKKRSRKNRVSITRNGYVIIWIFVLNMDLINQIRKALLILSRN